MKSVISTKNIMLQMVFKGFNNTAGPHSLVPHLFVFGAYFCIVIDFLSSVSQWKQANAMTKAINKLRKLKTQQKVPNTLNSWNGLDMI